MKSQRKKKVEDPALNVVLFQPEIPANTGNIARLCGAANLKLHLIHPLGFKTDDKHLKRAGLDYWSEIDITYHNNFEEFLKNRLGNSSNLIAFSRHAKPVYTDAEVKHGNFLLFGQETNGLPEDIRKEYECYRVPIWGKVRSLNLSTTVGIVVYHYLYKMGIF